MRKREILSEVNDLVQFFNSNNKAVRDAAKTAKTERDVSELTTRNRKIQIEVHNIDQKILNAKEYAIQIDKRLDTLTQPLISQLQEKYKIKNQLIDNCDEQFDACQKITSKCQVKAEECQQRITEVI